MLLHFMEPVCQLCMTGPAVPVLTPPLLFCLGADVWQMTSDGMDAPYPERPGEQDCPFYMRTGLCGFGMSCRFNHPPNRKLVGNTRTHAVSPLLHIAANTCSSVPHHFPFFTQAAAAARGKGDYPERIGQPECQVPIPVFGLNLG